MEFIIMILIFLHGIFWHELGHIGYYLITFKDYPYVRIRTTHIKITPKAKLTYLQQSEFLACGIILGMMSFVPFFYLWSFESALALIGYLVACGMDFYSLVIIHMRTHK